jgi:hypothetical protein
LFCPISARVEAFKGHDDEILISLWSVEGTARASGTLALYSGNLRYRVPFNNVIAASMINDAIPPTPIVIRFDTPTVIDSGYVGSLGNGECLIHSPFVRTKLETYVQTYGSDFPINSPIYPNWTAGLQKFRAAAAVTPAVLAAGARVDPPACDKPYVWASTTYAAPLEFPSSKMYTGLVAVRVTLDTSGRSTTRPCSPRRIHDSLRKSTAAAPSPAITCSWPTSWPSRFRRRSAITKRDGVARPRYSLDQ